MVGMHMRVDHIADRQRRARADGRLQSKARREAAARVDHRHAIAAYDKGAVGDIAQIFGIRQRDLATCDKNPLGDLAHVSRCHRLRPRAVRSDQG
jgi:hypothetical protein